MFKLNNIFRNFERQRSTLKNEAGEKCSRQQYIKQVKSKNDGIYKSTRAKFLL